FRGALLLTPEAPGRLTRHDRLDDGIAARVAPLFRRDDEAALGERVRVIATGILRPPNDTLSVRPVTNHHFSIPAFLAPADEVLLPDRWTVGCDAVCRRAPAVRVFDHRRAAFGTVLLRALDDSDLRQGMRVSACGIPVE